MKTENADEHDGKEATDSEAGPANEENASSNGGTASVGKEPMLITLLPNATKDEAMTSPPSLNQQIVWVPKTEPTYPVNLYSVKRLSYSQVHIRSTFIISFMLD